MRTRNLQNDFEQDGHDVFVTPQASLGPFSPTWRTSRTWSNCSGFGRASVSPTPRSKNGSRPPHAREVGHLTTDLHPPDTP